MMAAGQNPLQLAMQQGTQITQVIGPMGAAGAAKALKSALVSMVSPMTLITIGSIAAGAAMVNWLTGASEDAETLEDQLEAVGQAIDTFAEKAAQGRLSTAELIQEFGKASPELRLVLADMAALAKIDAQKAIDTTAKSVRGLILELSWWDARSSVSAAQDFLGLGSIGSAAREAGSAFARNLELLDSNEDAATRLAAALDVREQLLQAAGGLDKDLAAQWRGTYRRLDQGRDQLAMAGFSSLDDLAAHHLVEIDGWPQAQVGDIAAIQESGEIALGIFGGPQIHVLSLDGLDYVHPASAYRVFRP